MIDTVYHVVLWDFVLDRDTMYHNEIIIFIYHYVKLSELVSFII